jgi:hypothetical protein
VNEEFVFDESSGSVTLGIRRLCRGHVLAGKPDEDHPLGRILETGEAALGL